MAKWTFTGTLFASRRTRIRIRLDTRVFWWGVSQQRQDTQGLAFFSYPWSAEALDNRAAKHAATVGHQHQVCNGSQTDLAAAHQLLEALDTQGLAGEALWKALVAWTLVEETHVDLERVCSRGEVDKVCRLVGMILVREETSWDKGGVMTGGDDLWGEVRVQRAATRGPLSTRTMSECVPRMATCALIDAAGCHHVCSLIVCGCDWR